jgi:hypothetical protein
VWPPARYEQLAKNQSYLFKVNIIADDIVIWVTPKNDSYVTTYIFSLICYLACFVL